jgi:HEPN domain-containing protein
MCSESSNLDYSTSEGRDAGGSDSKKRPKYEEWFRQSDYDLEVADTMLTTGRNIYCIFMCHLSLEKALKGLYIKRTGKFPVKSHNLIYFVEETGLALTPDASDFVKNLNRVSVPTRYPTDLEKLQRTYTKELTLNILTQSQEIQQWIKQQ